MLAVRVIPTLLWKDVGLVKGVKFDSWRRIGSIIPAVKVYNARNVDELILLDISATDEKRKIDYEMLRKITDECFFPITVGGGVRTLDDIQMLLKNGADKVALNTICYEDPDFVKKASIKFGKQCIVASIDVKSRHYYYHCYSHSGKKDAGIGAYAHAIGMEDAGVGEILITSIDKDGTMNGYDQRLIFGISSMVKIPMIASGGCDGYQDMHGAIKSGASAVAAASIFHFTEATPLEAAKYLAEQGVPVRLEV